MVGPLLVAFIVVPLAEIYVIVQVGQAIGAWWTVAALLAESLLGAWLVRREGLKAWRHLVAELAQGRPPTRAAADGGLVLLGGLLLLTPGFISDILGLLLLLPPTRAVVRAILVRRFADRMIASPLSSTPTPRPTWLRSCGAPGHRSTNPAHRRWT